MAAIRHHHILQGFPNSLVTSPRLSMVLRGIQRSKSHGRTRRAISTATLGKIVNHLITEYPSTTHDRYMLAAATCLAFYALLRVSEFASPTRSSFLSHRTLARQDIKIKKHTISLRIRASKTDQQRRGHTLLVGCTHTSPCPVELLTRYLQLRKHSSSQSPLKDGSYLTQRTSRMVHTSPREHSQQPSSNHC